MAISHLKFTCGRITIAVLVIWHLLEIDYALQGYTSEIEQAIALKDTGMALVLFLMWFGVLVGALVLGLILKDSNIVEKEPTGPLANTE